MPVTSLHGELHTLTDDRRVGGGLCAIALRDSRLVGTCILQSVATRRTRLDAAAPHRLVLADGRSAEVRILKHSLSDCGPEIVRFEGPLFEGPLRGVSRGEAARPARRGASRGAL